MNRVIKFRALDFSDNLILNVGKIEFFTNGGILVNDEIPVKQLIQFTGLLDRNGVKIYEGDIITVDERNGKSFYKIEYAEYRFVRIDDRGFEKELSLPMRAVEVTRYPLKQLICKKKGKARK